MFAGKFTLPITHSLDTRSPNIGQSMRLRDPRKFALALALYAVGLLGCGGSDPSVPDTIALNSNTISFTSIGQTQQLTATVTDQRGDPFPEASVTWSSTDQAVATVSNTGLVTAQGAGQAQVTVTAGEVTAIAGVSVVPTPAALKRIAGNDQTGVAGQPLPQPLVVEVDDALDHPIAGVSVTFTVTQGDGSVQPGSGATGTDGRISTTFTLGSDTGDQLVTAVVAGSSISATFPAIAISPTPGISAAAGNGQSAPAGSPVPIPPSVQVLDAQLQPMAGVTVSFQVTGGGGSVSGGETTTNASGIATVGSWTIGSGGINTMTATAAGPSLDGNPVTFVATTDAAGGYNIQIRYLGVPSSDQLLAFARAEIRWESLVTGDLANVPIAIPSGKCGSNAPEVDETIDDLVIFATLQPIDGPGATLGAAGPCFIRNIGEQTIIGRMFFDVADLELIETNDLLDEVILHEMMHVLGFGTLWEEQGLLADKSQTTPPTPPGVDPHFTGAQAIGEFDDAGGDTYTGGKVPVENEGGAGTADSHWRETVFGSELMTGFVDLGTNPLSRISIASLADMGYVVDLAEADPYSLGPGLRITEGRRMLRLENDVIRDPIRQVDASGQVVGVRSR
jgi:Bacterial Ig-like domain (group 2)/Leishmanolysin